MLSAIAVVDKVAPRAHQNYRTSIERGTSLFEEYAVNTPLRLAHFLAQFIGHETAGGTVLREAGNYRAARIIEIFGVGRHSAAVTKAEASRLAGNGPALFDRVYGVGNPAKARELGNLRPGDGWIYRGGGLPQLTGGDAYRRYGIGDDPEQVASAEHALEIALRVWKEKGCGPLADRNDIREITRRINGGYNGYADRVAWFNRIWPMLRDPDGDAESWKVAQESEQTRLLQANLVSLGYDVQVDGRIGPKTTAAIVAFQKANGLRADGIAGEITLATISARLSSPAPTIGSYVVADPPPVAPPVATGVSAIGLAEAGQQIVDKADALQGYAGLSTYFGYGAGALMALGIAIITVGVVRSYVIPAIRPAKAPVPL